MRADCVALGHLPRTISTVLRVKEAHQYGIDEFDLDAECTDFSYGGNIEVCAPLLNLVRGLLCEKLGADELVRLIAAEKAEQKRMYTTEELRETIRKHLRNDLWLRGIRDAEAEEQNPDEEAEDWTRSNRSLIPKVP